MNYKFEKAEKSTVKVFITLDANEWDAAQTDAYNKTKGKYSLPGFRKGKVPMRVLENTYGKGLFFEDAVNEAFPKYYFEILGKEPSIEAVGLSRRGEHRRGRHHAGGDGSRETRRQVGRVQGYKVRKS